MSKVIQLKRTPIREIILTVSFKESIEIECLNKFQNLEEIKQKFTKVQTGFSTQVEAKKENEMPTANVQNDGYVLRSPEPSNRIIQARRGLLSFHKVQGYENFDVLHSELVEYWNALLKCTPNGLTINNISVRYLNFIESTPEESIKDLVNIYAMHPFENILNNFTQLRFKYSKIPEIIVNLVTARGDNNDKEGIIFDIILNRRINNLEEKPFDLLKEMREVKNELFFEGITQLTIQKYNQ